jgi:hypothetical protein
LSITLNQNKVLLFRIWTTNKLKEYIIKGFILNDERFKDGKSINCFDELKKARNNYQQKLANPEELKKSIIQKIFNGELQMKKLSA